MQNFKYFLYIFFKTKFIFTRPKRSKFLLYDQGITFNLLMKKTLKANKDIQILYARLEVLNFYVLWKLIVNFKFLNRNTFFYNYLSEYFSIVKPSFIITSNHYDHKFFRLREQFKNKTKFILVQTMPAYKHHFSHLKKKFTIDAVFCFDNFSKKIYQKKFKSKFFTIGSFKSNFYPIKKNLKKKGILLISGFKENFINKKISLDGLDVTHEKNILNFLIKYSSQKKINLKILLKPNVKISDYLKYYKISKKFLIKNTANNPYFVLDRFKLVLISNYSFMSSETASRGTKFGLIVKYNHPKNRLHKNNFFTYKKKLDDVSANKFTNGLLASSKKNFLLKFKKEGFETFFDNKNKTLLKYIKNN